MVGRGNEPDVEIMAYAAEQGCVVLTHDMDFGAILAATHGEKPSVIQLRMEDVTPQAAGPPSAGGSPPHGAGTAVGCTVNG